MNDSRVTPEHQLSDVQTQTLLLVFISDTPVNALSTIQANEKTYAASKVLAQKGLITTSVDGVSITDAGIAMLDAVNVVDKNGERTPYGEEELEKAIALTKQTESVWPLISSASRRV